MITAVITNYNKPPEILKRCIDSVVAQGLKYILVDDASDSTEHLEQYENVIMLDENVGAYKAFEIGLNLVDTRYVMRVDGDDYITGVPQIDENYDAIFLNIDGKVTLDVEEFICRPYAGLNGGIIRTNIMKKEWFSGVLYYGDIINFVKIISKYKCKLLDESTYVYDRDYSFITKMDSKLRFEYIENAKKLAREENREGVLKWLKNM